MRTLMIAGMLALTLTACAAGDAPREAAPSNGSPSAASVSSAPTEPSASASSPVANGALRVAGQVDIVEHEGVVRLCFVYRQSSPPCDSGGVVVEGEIDWAAVGGVEEGKGWIALDVWLVGDYADGILTLTEPASLTQPKGVTLPAEPTNVPLAPYAEVRAAGDEVLAAFRDQFDLGLLNVTPRWPLEGDQPQFDRGAQLEVWLMVATPELEAEIVDVADEHIAAEAVVFKRWFAQVG